MGIKYSFGRHLTPVNIAALAAATPHAHAVGRSLHYRFNSQLRDFHTLNHSAARFYGGQSLVAAAVIRFDSLTTLTATGHITGSAAITFGDAANLSDANSGVNAITGSSAITFGSSSVIANGNFRMQGTATITFGGTGDATPSKGRIRAHSTTTFTSASELIDIGQPPSYWVGLPLAAGFRRWGAPSVAALSPRIIATTSLGALTGHATIQFGSTTDLSAPAALAASEPITFGTHAVLANVGGPGTVQITGSSSITFSSATTLISVKPMTGTALIRFINSGSVKGKTRLVAEEPITFTGSAAVRANTHIEGTAPINFDVRATYLDNIGVDLIYGSCSIVFSSNVVGDVRYVKWQPEDRKGGAWGEQVSSTKSWVKSGQKTGTWDEEST